LIHCPPEKSGGHFKKIDEVKNAAGDSPWETGGCFFRGFLSMRLADS
jgi:hypothetical protein